MRTPALVATLGALFLSTPALHAEGDNPTSPPPADKQTQCVMLRTISGWSRIDDRTLLLRSAGRRYRVHFYSPCYEANWAYSARVDHPGMCLRPGDMMIFEMDSSPMGPRWNRGPHRGFEERCLIQSIERTF